MPGIAIHAMGRYICIGLHFEIQNETQKKKELRADCSQTRTTLLRRTHQLNQRSEDEPDDGHFDGRFSMLIKEALIMVERPARFPKPAPSHSTPGLSRPLLPDFRARQFAAQEIVADIYDLSRDGLFRVRGAGHVRQGGLRHERGVRRRVPSRPRSARC